MKPPLDHSVPAAVLCCDARRRTLLRGGGASALLGWAAVAAWSQPPAGERVRIGGTGAGVDALARVFDGSWATGLNLVVVPSLGSGGGMKALSAGAIDVAVLSRPLTPEEQARGLREVEVFRSPLVWATGASNRVGGVSLSELMDIYAGRMLQWPGGAPVRPVLRPLGDTDTTAVQAAYPELGQALRQALQRPGVRVAMTDAEAVDDLRHIPGAVGTTVLGLVQASQGALRALDVDGVTPSLRALAEGRWRAHKVVRLVMMANGPAVAARLLQHVVSAPAQTRLARLGHLQVRGA